MWLLFAMILLNAAVGSHAFLFEHRLSLGGFPVNILDGLLILVFFIALIRKTPPGIPPRGYVWTLGLWIVALIVGACMGLANLTKGVDVRGYVTALRDFSAIPISIFCTYKLLRDARSLRIALFIHLLAGVLTAIAILLFFKGRGEQYGIGSHINSLRNVDYVPGYAGLTAIVLLFAVLSGARLIWKPIALLVATVCVWGNIAPLNRSDWLAFMISTSAAVLLIPSRTKFISRLVKLLLGWTVLIVVVVAGANVSSMITRSDQGTVLWDRFQTMIPGAGRGDKMKAWDTRVPGIKEELRIWSENVVTGGGFTIQSIRSNFNEGAAYNHNAWTSTMAQTGLLGLAALVCMFWATYHHGCQLIRSRTQDSLMLMGCLGAAGATYVAVYGASTTAWLTQRGGLLLGVLCGMVLRASSIQQHMLQSLEGYLEESDYGYDAGPLLGPDGLPAMSSEAY